MVVTRDGSSHLRAKRRIQPSLTLRGGRGHLVTVIVGVVDLATSIGTDSPTVVPSAIPARSNFSRTVTLYPSQYLELHG